ncbi:hypothetical protein D3C80_2127320 [compost metagenome]
MSLESEANVKKALARQEHGSASVGAGAPANTDAVGASHRAGFFAGMPAPTCLALIHINFKDIQNSSNVIDQKY